VQLVLAELLELFISLAFDDLFAKLYTCAFGTNCSDVLAIRQTNLAPNRLAMPKGNHHGPQSTITNIGLV